MERVEVTPAAGDDDVILPTEGTDPDSPQGNDGTADEGGEADPNADPADESPDGKPEGLRRQPTQTETPASPGAPEVVVPGAPATDPSNNPDGLKRLPNESQREYALRLELTKTRGLLRTQRTGEIMETIRPGAPSATAPALSEHAQEVLGKYKPEELAALREVLPVLAEQMGFVRKDEIAGTSYAEKAQDALDGFLEKHPEYKPEHDPDGALWGAFKTEFGQYKQPTDPKDYRRLFEKVHTTVFGIQPGGALPKVSAAQRKVQVASHAGASGPTAPSRQMRPGSGASSGLRLDMLKGFDDETKERIASRAGGE